MAEIGQVDNELKRETDTDLHKANDNSSEDKHVATCIITTNTVNTFSPAYTSCQSETKLKFETNLPVTSCKDEKADFSEYSKKCL